jgi:hypothetical protein
MALKFPVHLRGAHARVVDRMVEEGAAENPHEAVETALLAFGRQTGILDEFQVLKSLQAQAARDPMGDREIAEAIRRVAKGRADETTALVLAVERPDSQEAHAFEQGLQKPAAATADAATLAAVSRFFETNRTRAFAWMFDAQLRRVFRVLAAGDPAPARDLKAAPAPRAIYDQKDLVRSLVISAIVGTALVIINVRPGQATGNPADGPDFGRIFLNYLVPFLVASASATLSNLSRRRTPAR